MLFLMMLGMTEAGNLKFKGRDFFMISNWSPVWDGSKADLAEPDIFASGANAVWLHADINDAAKLRETVAVAKKFERQYPDVAIVVVISNSFVFPVNANGKPGLYSATALPGARRKLRDALKCFQDNRNIFGFSLDEPENSLHQSYAQWLTENKFLPKDYPFTRYLAMGLGWLYEEIKQLYPSAYFLPVMAWWNCYEDVADCYDILTANSYPVTNPEKIPGGSFYELIYDARAARETVVKHRKAGFIYMPAGFNILAWPPWGGMREYSAGEIRYMWLAPVTLDANGICGWIMYRATEEFARKKILPVMQELKALTPWLQGEDCRTLLTSDHQELYIHRMRKVIKMAGQETEDFTNMEVAPECTWIFKRNPVDGSYLLLAANNTPQELAVRFQLAEELRRLAVDSASDISRNSNGSFVLKLKPCDIAVIKFKNP